jgi:flagellar protein FliS
MFASPFSTPSAANRRHTAGLYQQVGVESQLAGASPHHLVTMLFDGFMEAVAQARGALRAGDHAVKGQAVSRAVRIIEEGLRAGLDMRAGGSLAQDLSDLYTYVTMRLTIGNLRNDEEALAECQRLMQPLREAWQSIGGPAAARGAAAPALSLHR